MKKIYSIVLVIICFSPVSAKEINILRPIKVTESMNLELNCRAIYNATYIYMKARFSEEVARYTAAMANQACNDEKEAAAGTNPGCTPVSNELKN